MLFLGLQDMLLMGQSYGSFAKHSKARCKSLTIEPNFEVVWGRKETSQCQLLNGLSGLPSAAVR